MVIFLHAPKNELKSFIAFLITGIDQWLWTSGMIIDDNKTLKWVGNNKPVTYTNWNKDEPNNLTGKEKCVNVYFTWNDNDCNEKIIFVCERSNMQ